MPWRWILLALLPLLPFMMKKGYYMLFEAQFAITPVNRFEIKQLPVAIQLEASTLGDYHSHADQMFRQLFNYIRAHDISMTTPVEGDLKPGKMRFYVSLTEQSKVLASHEVTSREQPPRTVASLGQRGAYSEHNIAVALSELQQRLDQQQQLPWQTDGEPYVVFWHGPFMPDVLKLFEVHQPLKPLSAP